MLSRRFLSSALGAWERVQVELQGQYSVARLRELVDYSNRVGSWRTAATIIHVPVISMAVNLLIDAMPLVPPESADILHQTVGLHFRMFLTGAIVAALIVMQIHTSSPTLPLSFAQHMTVTVASGITTLGGYIVDALIFAFPTPFAIQAATNWWLGGFISSLWILWRRALRDDKVAKENLMRYMNVFAVQVVVVFLYSAYTVAYTSVPSQYQTLVSILLPLLKLSSKNWVHRGVFHMEDLAPVVVVFNIDVFHAVFMSSTMQQARTIGSLLVVIVVDVLQSTIAYYEMNRVLAKAERYAGARSVKPTADKSSTNLHLKGGIFKYALQTADENEKIRNHSDVALVRHLRQRVESSSVLNGRNGNHPRSTVIDRFTKPISSQISMLDSRHIHPVRTTDQLQTSEEKLTREERMKLGAVKNSLRVLHMVEFYVLIEFVEVIIALIYTTYLFAMTQLPNRMYYTQLRKLSHDELVATAIYVGQYAGYELISFVVLCALLDRRMRPFSTMRLLAFVLQKHWHMVQSTMVMWIFFIVQLTLVHHGTDYTFKFTWLRSGSAYEAP